MTPYYQDQAVTIWHGDCREILPQLEPVDLVLTDPPYGIGVDSEMHKKGGQQYGNAAAPKKYYESTDWDHRVSVNTINQIRCYAKFQIIWGGNYYTDFLPRTRCWLIWDKENADNQFSDCEVAWTNFDKPIRIKRHMWNGMIRKHHEYRYDHPTQKPLEIMNWAILQAPQNAQTILDPFLGSGTTLRAAKDLGRKAIGIEIEEKYCEIAAKRMAKEVLLLT